jgi:hypothetical protein
VATVNFSVPDEVKASFDAAFKGRNKSATLVIADPRYRQQVQGFGRLVDLREWS